MRVDLDTELQQTTSGTIGTFDLGDFPRMVDIIQIGLRHRVRFGFMVDKMNKVRLIGGGDVIDGEPEARVTGSDGIRGDRQVLIFTHHIHMSVGIDMSAKHLTRRLFVEDECLMGINMQVEGKITELLVVDGTVQIHFVAFLIDQMHVGETNGGGIQDDGVMRDGIACSGPRQGERRILRCCPNEHVGITFVTAYHHLTGSRSVEIGEHRRGPVVNKGERHCVSLHIEVPCADTVEERFTFKVHEFMIRLVVHVGMESERVGDMQIHFGITEINVVQSHRVDMYLRVHLRFGEHTCDVRFSGEQTIEHDRLDGQQERHNIRRVYLLQGNRQGVLRVGGRHTVGTDMLPASFEGKMIHLQGRVSSTIGDPTLRKGVDRVTQEQRAGHQMQVDERLFVIAREMREQLEVTSVVSSPLCRKQYPLFLSMR